MDTIRVTATEFQSAVGMFSDKAIREPVTITKQGRDHLVLLSAEEFIRMKRRDRKVCHINELSDKWVEAVSNVKMAARHDHLNSLLES
jgi:PHD/YefM family antitoxin component YafN of YafNO toxin-antitoxin module